MQIRVIPIIGTPFTLSCFAVFSLAGQHPETHLKSCKEKLEDSENRENPRYNPVEKFIAVVFAESNVQSFGLSILFESHFAVLDSNIREFY